MPVVVQRVLHALCRHAQLLPPALLAWIACIVAGWHEARALVPAQVDKERGPVRHSADVAQKWHGAVANIGSHFLKMQGLDVGACEIVLHVRPCEGLIRQLDGTVEKRFAAKELLCPIQVWTGGAFPAGPSPTARDVHPVCGYDCCSCAAAMDRLGWQHEAGTDACMLRQAACIVLLHRCTACSRASPASPCLTEHMPETPCAGCAAAAEGRRPQGGPGRKWFTVLAGQVSVHSTVPDARTPLPDQATLRHNKAEDPRLDAAAVQAKTGPRELAVGDCALFLGRTHFGCLATVLPDVSRGLSKQVTRAGPLALGNTHTHLFGKARVGGLASSLPGVLSGRLNRQAAVQGIPSPIECHFSPLCPEPIRP